jgi:ribonuclease D
MQLPSDQLPVYPRRKIPRVPPRVPPRVKGLKEWRDILATRLELDPALILNKSLMREIAQKKPKSISELVQVPGVCQWQAEDFGEQIISVLSRLP